VRAGRATRARLESGRSPAAVTTSDRIGHCSEVEALLSRPLDAGPYTFVVAADALVLVLVNLVLHRLVAHIASGHALILEGPGNRAGRVCTR